MGEHYILDDREVVPCDLMTWAKSIEDMDMRRVARTEISDEIHVSTVFLGLDHSFGNGPLLLFETMIFGGELDQEMDRYITYDQAEVGHKNMVDRVKDNDRER